MRWLTRGFLLIKSKIKYEKSKLRFRPLAEAALFWIPACAGMTNSGENVRMAGLVIEN